MSTITVRGVVFASLSAVAAFANVAVAVPAHAAERDAPTAAVRFADLDLASANGVATLDRRLRAAAATVCGSADARDLARMAPINRCRAAALTGAAPQVALAVENARGGVKVASAATLRVATR